MGNISINFYLDSKSKKPNKTIFAYIGGAGKKRFVRHTGYKIHPKDWDKKNQQPKKTYVDYSIINSHLKHIVSKINDLNARLFRSESTISIDSFEKELNKIFNKEIAQDSHSKFYTAFDEFLKLKRHQKSTRTIQKYNSLLNHLRAFEKKEGERITFETIDNRFRDKFTNYLIDVKEHTNNTIEKYLSCLMTFLNWALDEELHTTTKFKKFKLNRYTPTVVSLTKKELSKIYNFDFSYNKHFEIVRDIFCFQCFTGQRYSDILNLRFSEVDKKTWILRTVKTKDLIKIPLVPPAVKILLRHKKNGDSFPAIPIQKMNSALKDIAAKAELNTQVTITSYQGAKRIDNTLQKWELISTKIARKTFVTLNNENKMGIKEITNVTGHKKLEMLKPYLNSDLEHTRKELLKAWSDFK